MVKTEMIYDMFCAWPYHEPYGMVEVEVKKPPRKRAPRRRSFIAKDLFSPKYRAKLIPNKKRKNDRSKVTRESYNGGDE